MFTLHFKAKLSGALLSEVLRLNPKILDPQVFSPALQKGELKLVFTDGQTTGTTDPDAAGLRLLQNRPNPFSGSTTIGFVLPEACTAQLRVFDAAGRALWQLDKNYPAGYHEEAVQVPGALTAGVLYYELRTPQGTLTRRMVAL